MLFTETVYCFHSFYLLVMVMYLSISLERFYKWAKTQLINKAFDIQLKIKISDNNLEWRFDESFIIFKFKGQILMSSLYIKSACESLVAYD